MTTNLCQNLSPQKSLNLTTRIFKRFSENTCAFSFILCDEMTESVVNMG